MKRTLIPGLMLLAAFTLTNCSEQLVPPVQGDDVIVEETPSTEMTEEESLGVPFEVYANAADDDPETKTTNINGGNYTAWDADDAIYVYHTIAGQKQFIKNYKFSMRNLSENLFGGALAEIATLSPNQNYDWYFIYPNTEANDGIASDSPSSKVTANLIIGSSTQVQKPITVTKEGAEGETEILYSNKVHIAGDNYPMYGKTSQPVPGDKNPRIQMKHLSALIAIKVVNQGDAPKDNLDANKNGEKPITIKEISFSVPTVSTVDENKQPVKQTALPIVGAFNVDITDEVSAASFTPVSGSSSNSVTLSLPESVTIDPGEDATFYLAVRPFDAISNQSELKFTNKTAITLDISINGSKRSVEVPANTKFEAGKVTTLRVPVKLSYPKKSDAIDVTCSTGEKVLQFPVAAQDLSANGEIVSAYIIGDGELQELTIIGTGKDMINALDVGFYASSWQGRRAAMTVSNINVWFPNSDGSLSKLKDYKPLTNVLTSEIKDDLGFFGFLAGSAVSVVMGTLSDGIPRDDTGTLSFIYLTKFIDPQSITFNGVVENGSVGANESIFFLDEAPIYKEIKEDTVDDLLMQRFAFNNQVPTFAGLLDIVNEKNTDAANATASVLYQKLYDVVASRGNMSMSAAGVDFTINLGNVFNAMISGPDDLKAKLPKMKFEIKISTCPYKPLKTDYGSKASPIKLENISGDKNPLIFWGLDVYGPESSVAKQ